MQVYTDKFSEQKETTQWGAGDHTHPTDTNVALGVQVEFSKVRSVVILHRKENTALTYENFSQAPQGHACSFRGTDKRWKFSEVSFLLNLVYELTIALIFENFWQLIVLVGPPPLLWEILKSQRPSIFPIENHHRADV